VIGDRRGAHAALCTATLTWKSFFPELSLWTFAAAAFPLLKLLLSIPALGYYNQLFSNWRFLLFAAFLSTSYWYCWLAVPILQKLRASDPSEAITTFKTFLVAFLWPLLEATVRVWQTGQKQGIDGKAENFAARCLAHH